MAVDVPDAETVAAMEELDNGGGVYFTGTTIDLHELLLKDDEGDTNT